MRVEVDAEKLAEEIATEIFEWQVSSGFLKRTKVLHYEEEQMGRHHYRLTPIGEAYIKNLKERWLKKITSQ
jgi:predicted transcriptional regulator